MTVASDQLHQFHVEMDSVASAPGTVLLFPGQGSQAVGMARDFSGYSEFKDAFDEASNVVGFDVMRACTTAGAVELNSTALAQPTILTMSIGLFRVLESRVDLGHIACAGHSLGEYAALVATKALRFSDALELVSQRARLMAQASGPSSGMLAYLGDRAEDVEACCAEICRARGVVEIANYNGPSQLILSGDDCALTDAAAIVEQECLGATVRLSVSGAFHSSLMTPVLIPMREAVNAMTLAPIQGHVVSSVSADAYTGLDYPKRLLADQVVSPVRWTQTVQRMTELSSGHPWVEVGPGRVLAKLAKRLRAQPMLSTHSKASIDHAISVLNERGAFRK